jgi:RNA polymerase sigma-54 factor
MKQSLQLKLGQQLTMTPQLQQAIRLLQLSTLDLQQEIQEALDSNPMLEIEEPQESDDTDRLQPEDNIQAHSVESSGASRTGEDSGAERDGVSEWDGCIPSPILSDRIEYFFRGRHQDGSNPLRTPIHSSNGTASKQQYPANGEGARTDCNACVEATGRRHQRDARRRAET